MTIHGTYAYFPKGALRYRTGGHFTLVIGDPLHRADFPTTEALIEKVEETVHQAYQTVAAKKQGKEEAA